MDDNMLWALGIKCATVIILAIILSVTAYSIWYQYAPVRPVQTDMYYWPPVMGSSINGNSNTFGPK